MTTYHWAEAGGFGGENDFAYDVQNYFWTATLPVRSHVERVVAGVAVSMYGHSFKPFYDLSPTPMLWKFSVVRQAPSTGLHPGGLTSVVNRQVGALDMTMMADHTKSLLAPADGLYSGEQLVMWHGATETVDTRRSDGSVSVDEGAVTYTAGIEVRGHSYSVSGGAAPWIKIKAWSFLRVLYTV